MRQSEGGTLPIRLLKKSQMRLRVILSPSASQLSKHKGLIMTIKDQAASDYIKDQMADHITALENEIDRQDALIKLLVQALFLTYGENK